MVATNWFVSIAGGADPSANFGGQAGSGSTIFNHGASSTAADYIELRMMKYTTGTTSAGLTKKDVRHALKQFERYLLENQTTDMPGL